MQTTGVKPGDIIEIEVRGQYSFARICDPMHPTKEHPAFAKDKRNLNSIFLIEPLRPGIALTTRQVTARQIVGHYKKRKGSR
jgi:hypothetical protein